MILLYFSGGCDSAAMLQRYLTETKEEIHAHYCIIKSERGRWALEYESARRIVEVFQNIRPFEFSAATVDVRTLGQKAGYPFSVIYPLTGAAVMKGNPSINKVAHGTYMKGDSYRSLPVMDAIHTCVAGRHVPVLFPNMGIAKSELLSSLSPDIRSFVFTCYRPIRKNGGLAACLRCEACQRLTQAKLALGTAGGVAE